MIQITLINYFHNQINLTDIQIFYHVNILNYKDTYNLIKLENNQYINASRINVLFYIILGISTFSERYVYCYSRSYGEHTKRFLANDNRK